MVGRKRKAFATGNIRVNVDDDNGGNRSCRHGPLVAFERVGKDGTVEKFFSCSASRDGRCVFHAKADHVQTARHTKVAKVDRKSAVVKGSLQPLTSNKNEAQYFFTPETVEFIASLFVRLQIEKTICIGAPTVHKQLLEATPIKSLLLDIDNRYDQLYDPTAFLRYNMFNDFFFGGEEAQTAFRQFLKDDDDEASPGGVCILLDPPFGGRTELLAKSLRSINDLYSSTNSNTSQRSLAIFWVFPYFMEHYIQSEMPQLHMADYRVNYANHKTYCTGNASTPGRLKYGSPVRIFTNVPLDLIVLPTREGYKLCTVCRKYVAAANKHCAICRRCPSKNGAPYRHCGKCNRCVKPTYTHCTVCNRCTVRQGHDCRQYQLHITCGICLLRGHTEIRCQFWKTIKKKPIRSGGCMVCGDRQHTLQHCPERIRALEEFPITGNVTASSGRKAVIAGRKEKIRGKQKRKQEK